MPTWGSLSANSTRRSMACGRGQASAFIRSRKRPEASAIPTLRAAPYPGVPVQLDETDLGEARPNEV